ncbi:LysR family transcriptional regulator [Brevibacterium album]|uniref:LysR family transcriptional regulator n=1 Tax=Brevibacterium album TaxID=417948 RepID=UPI0003F8BA98|nr:LysR family transcriptional regulator [Brevibacterium album]
MDLSIEQIESFIAVAEEGSVSRAARRLALTQPPVSRRVQHLEGRLGCRLFRRSSEGMVLTAVGEQFLRDAYRITALVAESFDRARMQGGEAKGEVEVGFTSISTYAVMPKLLKLTAAYTPGLDVRIAERISPQQIDLVSRGRLDLGFVRPQRLPSNVRRRVVERAPVIALVPRRHPLAEQPGPLTPQDLLALPLVRYEHGGSPFLARLHDSVFAGAAPPARFEVSQTLSGAAIVGEGIAAMLAPVSVAKLELPGLAFRRITLPASAATVPLWAVYGAEAKSPLVDAVLAMFDELAEQLAREHSGLMSAIG